MTTTNDKTPAHRETLAPRRDAGAKPRPSLNRVLQSDPEPEAPATRPTKKAGKASPASDN